MNLLNCLGFIYSTNLRFFRTGSTMVSTASIDPLMAPPQSPILVSTPSSSSARDELFCQRYCKRNELAKYFRFTRGTSLPFSLLPVDDTGEIYNNWIVRATQSRENKFPANGKHT
ncbi:hypothetical protein Q8A67_021056 [Cirrhinus molitorella]|uniref:Uncharacterized protein n=1 Tax=Cirrhinus molitorella TaxID=172907 RepID=A0AA88PBH4_9TELE|nr:hypothetical protein Q8A67_021056 [Cirrhinus molitorella]